MKKTYYLIKKDFILCQEQIFLFLGVPFILPLILYYQVNTISTKFVPFFMTTIFVMFFYLNTVLTAENKNKGTQFLSVTPYSRKTIVAAKYLSILLMFIICVIAHSIAMPLVFGVKTLLDFNTIALSLFIICIYFSLFLPLIYKFGFEKVKLYFMTATVILPYILVVGVKASEMLNLSEKIDTSSLMGLLQNNFFYLFLFIISGFMIALSLKSSIKIYSKKDL